MMARFDGASSRARLLDEVRDPMHAAPEVGDFVDRDDAVARHVLASARARPRAPARRTRSIHVDHLPQRRRRRVDHVVAEDHGERLVADQVLGDEHGVAEPERLALPHVRTLDQLRDLADLFELLLLAALLEKAFELDVARRSDPRSRSCRGR